MTRSTFPAGAPVLSLRVFAAACGVLFYSHAVQAELGAAAETAGTDQIRFKGMRSSSTSGQMTTHEVRLPDGSGIKEYVNATGVVFAVSWRTRLKPDLHQLLGPQIAAQAATASVPSGVAGIKVRQSIRQPDLVVHQGGRMSAFAGLAYVPSLVPQGVNAEALR